MSAPANTNYGRDVFDDLPGGSPLLILVGLGLLSFAWPAALLGVVLAGILRILGAGPLALLGAAAMGIGLAIPRGFQSALDTYWLIAPVWKVSGTWKALGAFDFIVAVLPVALFGGALIGGVLWLVLDLRTPEWKERTKRRSIREHRRRSVERRAFHAGALDPSEGLALGETDQRSVVRLAPEHLRQHTLVLGATGTGKTTTLLTLAEGMVGSGAGLCVIDLKADPQFSEALALIAKAHGTTFQNWSIGGPARWNPFAHGDQTELMNKIIELEEWTEPHYKRSAQRYLQTAIGVLAELGEPRDLPVIARYLSPRALGELVDREKRSGKLPSARADEVKGYLATLDSSATSAIYGLANRIALISESSAAASLEGGEGAIDIGEALATGGVTCFSLNSARYGETAAQLAALVARDLGTVCAERIAARRDGQPPNPAYFLIDEFSGMPSDHVSALISRSARAAGVGVVLATQELADLTRIDPAFCDQVLGNTQVKVIHRQDVPESAERLANVAGTKTGWHQTFRVEHDVFAGRQIGHGRKVGEGSMTKVEQFRVHPNELKTLGCGRAVVIRKVPELLVDAVSVRAPDLVRLEAMAESGGSGSQGWAA